MRSVCRVERQQHSAHPISLLGEQERRDAAGGAQEGGQDAGGRRGHVRRLLSACPPAQHPEVINFAALPPNFFIRARKTLPGALPLAESLTAEGIECSLL